MANGVCLAHRASALLGRLSLPTPVRWTFLGHPSGGIGFRSRARSPSELFRGSGRPSWRQRRLPRPTSQLTEPDGKRRPGQNRRSPHVVFFHKSLRLSRAAPCVRARLEVFCVRGIGRIARVSLAQGGGASAWTTGLVRQKHDALRTKHLSLREGTPKRVCLHTTVSYLYVPKVSLPSGVGVAVS